MNLLSHHVDTFKEALYLNGIIDKYNDFVEDMISLKEQAQKIHDMNNDNRFVTFTMSGKLWQVMATSIKGYSVVLKSGDISMAFKKKGNVTDRNPSVKIEYRSSFLVNYGLIEAHRIVHEYFTKNIHKDFISKVQEIHMACDTQGYNFNLFDVLRFKTRSRRIAVHDGDDDMIGRQLVFSSRRVETLYFGSSNNMLRIYNKTLEIKKHPESGHVEKLWLINGKYEEYKDVWRCEFQIRRSVLKTLFTHDNLPYEYTNILLENLSGLWSFFITYFSFRDLNEDTVIDMIKGYRIKKDGTPKLLTKEAERQILKKSTIHPLWSLVSLYENTPPPYHFRFHQVKASSPIYAMNSACAVISTVAKHYGHVTPELLNQVFEMAQARSLKNNDVGLVDNSIKKVADYFHKVDHQRRIGLDVVEIDDAVKDNIGFYVADIMRPLIDDSRHKPLF